MTDRTPLEVIDLKIQQEQLDALHLDVLNDCLSIEAAFLEVLAAERTRVLCAIDGVRQRFGDAGAPPGVVCTEIAGGVLGAMDTAGTPAA
jgi:hypothetical protein